MEGTQQPARHHPTPCDSPPAAPAPALRNPCPGAELGPTPGAAAGETQPSAPYPGRARAGNRHSSSRPGHGLVARAPPSTPAPRHARPPDSADRASSGQPRTEHRTRARSPAPSPCHFPRPNSRQPPEQRPGPPLPMSPEDAARPWRTCFTLGPSPAPAPCSVRAWDPGEPPPGACVCSSHSRLPLHVPGVVQIGAGNHETRVHACPPHTPALQNRWRLAWDGARGGSEGRQSTVRLACPSRPRTRSPSV